MGLLLVTVTAPVYLPLPVLAHHRLTLPRCLRCNDKMPRPERHLCPDGAEELMT